MKRYLFGMLAIVLAFGAVAFTKSPAKQSKQSGGFTDYYYQFTGTHGQENDMSKWVQLDDVDEYNTFNCPNGSARACKIKNTTNSGGHPTSVPLTGAGLPNPLISPNQAAVNRSN